MAIKEIKNCKPMIFNPLLPADIKALEAVIIESNPLIIDALDHVIDEFLECKYALELNTGANLKSLRELWLQGRSVNEISCWIYYPWRNRVIRMLKKEYFIEVRTNRNLLKLSAEEQQNLAQKNILFIGLSVGQSAALAFAMQRIGGSFYLADFDKLSLSNMNRLRASILDIGEEKTAIAARAIAEMDPYIEINILNEGINAENIEQLLNPANGKNIDLVVEECDNISVKILTRQIARKYGIPVIMETSDRGMLDVERFDQEPQRPLFHGLVKETDLINFNSLSNGDKSEILFKIVDYKNLSARMQLSLENIGKTLQTWPQLGYEIVLGSATLSFIAMKLFLNNNVKSGRYYVDLDNILMNGD